MNLPCRLHWRRKRAQALLIIGTVQVGLGLSYLMQTTPTRARTFEWLPFSIEWIGVLAVACGAVTLAGSLLYRQSPSWDRAAWSMASVPFVALACLWIFSGVADIFDPQIDRGWSPWASALIYVGEVALIYLVSDWSEPLRLHASDDDQEAT